MNALATHGTWLSLMDISGPFLAEPVLRDAFPQGLEGLDAGKKTLVRQAYDEWREALDLQDRDLAKLHRAWIAFVLGDVLEWRRAGDVELLKHGPALPPDLRYDVPGHAVTLRPDSVLTTGEPDGKPLLLVATYAPEVSLTDATALGSWISSPAERMAALCRATGVRLGLVTNGERWMLVDASIGATSSFASWYARLWGPEELTLKSFLSLLGVRRFFVAEKDRLPELLDRSLTFQDDVTDALGEQVQRAVEVLIQTLDREDQNKNRELLHGIAPTELYEAGLTVMMRIVFLLSAEERGLLLLGDERYEAYYAVSTMRMQLRAESDEILERRWDAWARLLAIFRAVYGGIEHEALRLPAFGGSLFDPDRYPFLEGRPRGSQWKSDLAVPLPIDNRTVLLLLDAVQLFEGRTLSYMALDVEQIGYVYEGLLERTVIRAPEATLDLDATKNAEKPWVLLSELEGAQGKSEEDVHALLKERTGSSPSRIVRDLAKPLDEKSDGLLLTACGGDVAFRDRVRPYFHLLRLDKWGYPLVYAKSTFIVAAGADRRETGTHYTPKSFTRAIVKETLEPLAYVGPSRGLPRDEWHLKSAAELLELKICDPAMGSGAFLVEVCRWLGDRVVEAWSVAEAAGRGVTADGEVVDEIESHEPLRADLEERRLAARRLVAEHCLYGVDANPLAVELAKLALWLETLAKGRPFGFLDHNLRSGDSLLGLTSLDQLKFLQMKPNAKSIKQLFASRIDEAVFDAIHLRSELGQRPIRDIRDVEAMIRLNGDAKDRLLVPSWSADALMGAALSSKGRPILAAELATDIGSALGLDADSIKGLRARAQASLNVDLPGGKPNRRTFHWPLEFPEVFDSSRGGFDAFVGNPPFLGDKRLSRTFGGAYKDYLSTYLTIDGSATVDLVVFFFLRAFSLLKKNGCLGFLARRSMAEGRNREIGLEKLCASGASVRVARTNLEWPGKASVVVHEVHLYKGAWSGENRLNDDVVSRISSYLDAAELQVPQDLLENRNRMFIGTYLNGEGFKISAETAAMTISKSATYSEIMFPFVGGQEVNTDPRSEPTTWVINFWDWPEEKSRKYKLAFDILEKEVKPERTRLKEDGTFQLRKPLPQRWWHHGEKRPALYHAAGRGHFFEEHPKGWTKDSPQLRKVLVISRGATKYPAFTFLGNDRIFSEKLCVMTDERFSTFALLSSDIHSAWAWNNKTSIGADLYSLSYTQAIFERFPLPNRFFDSDDELDAFGREYWERRQRFMETQGKGLTKFYNDLHDENCRSAEMNALRSLRDEINHIVADRYSWKEINVKCAFHAVGYLPEGGNVRFTFSERTRQEVLRRLSLLNRDRYDKQVSAQPSPRPSGMATKIGEENGCEEFRLELTPTGDGKRSRKSRRR